MKKLSKVEFKKKFITQSIYYNNYFKKKDYDFPKVLLKTCDTKKSFLFLINSMTFTLSIEFQFYAYFHYSKTEPELNDQ